MLRISSVLPFFWVLLGQHGLGPLLSLPDLAILVLEVEYEANLGLQSELHLLSILLRLT